jgi:hypothetical protein
MGFSNCPSFTCGDGAKHMPRLYETLTRICPKCAEASGVGYDWNMVRVVERMGWGVKFGTGPDEEDWGVDVKFSSKCVVL